MIIYMIEILTRIRQSLDTFREEHSCASMQSLAELDMRIPL